MRRGAGRSTRLTITDFFVSLEAIEIVINGMGFYLCESRLPGQSEVWNENRVNVAK